MRVLGLDLGGLGSLRMKIVSNATDVMGYNSIGIISGRKLFIEASAQKNRCYGLECFLLKWRDKIITDYGTLGLDMSCCRMKCCDGTTSTCNSTVNSSKIMLRCMESSVFWTGYMNEGFAL